VFHKILTRVMQEAATNSESRERHLLWNMGMQ